MPRARRERAQAASTPESKLKQCLNALVSDPEAACMGGNDMCCTGCGGNSELVDSLCSFCLHSDAARKFFASNGGLDAIYLAVSNNQSERVVMAGLQLLSCLCTCPMGQHLVATQKPALLRQLCDQALDNDEDREGIQHGALMLLTEWLIDEEVDPALSGWFKAHPAPAQQQQSSTSQPSQQLLALSNDMKLSNSTDSANHTPDETSCVEGATGADAANNLSSSTSASPAAEPLLLYIAAQALQHPTLAIQKMGAQLFAAAATQQDDPAAKTTALAHLHNLVSKVSSFMQAEAAAAAQPRFAAFAHGSAQLLDPQAFMQEQHRLQQHKLSCHSLLHLISELSCAGSAAQGVLLQAAPAVCPALLMVFESAWRVGAVAGVPINMQVGCHPSSLPFSFLQDQQSRELALDALTLLLQQPGMLSHFGRSLAAADQPTLESDAAAETFALQRLLQLVKGMLTQQSAGHVRAALTLIGHTRFEQAPSPPPAAPPPTQDGQSDGSSAPPVSVLQMDIRIQWHHVLCEVFQAAWDAEAREAQRLQAAAPPPAPPPPPPPQTVDADGNLVLHPPPEVPAAQEHAGQGGAAAHRANPLLELGLGYRVLIQVLGSWKKLLEVGGPAVMASLTHTPANYLARCAAAHQQQQVSLAAYKLMYHGTDMEQRILQQEQALAEQAMYQQMMLEQQAEMARQAGPPKPQYPTGPLHHQQQQQITAGTPPPAPGAASSEQPPAATTAPSQGTAAGAVLMNQGLRDMSLVQQEAVLMTAEMPSAGVAAAELEDPDYQDFLSVFMDTGNDTAGTAGVEAPTAGAAGVGAPVAGGVSGSVEPAAPSPTPPAPPPATVITLPATTQGPAVVVGDGQVGGAAQGSGNDTPKAMPVDDPPSTTQLTASTTPAVAQVEQGAAQVVPAGTGAVVVADAGTGGGGMGGGGGGGGPGGGDARMRPVNSLAAMFANEDEDEDDGFGMGGSAGAGGPPKDAMFGSFTMMPAADASEEEQLAEALTLLPDLSLVASNTYNMPQVSQQVMMQMQGMTRAQMMSMASPYAMFNM